MAADIAVSVSAPEVAAEMKRYRFQALVTPAPTPAGTGPAPLDSAAHRMVLRCVNHETHRGQVFRVLVAAEGDMPVWRGRPQIIVTMNVIGDDVCDCLEIGSRFSLWNGDDVGQGIVTRRLPILL
jgi:hypothetical protein